MDLRTVRAGMRAPRQPGNDGCSVVAAPFRVLPHALIRSGIPPTQGGHIGPPLRRTSGAPCVRIDVAWIELHTLGQRRGRELARYGQSFKNRAVGRLLPPESASLEEVARA